MSSTKIGSKRDRVKISKMKTSDLATRLNSARSRDAHKIKKELLRRAGCNDKIALEI